MHHRTFKTWLINFKSKIPSWKKPWRFVVHRWTGECWDCGRCIETMFNVRRGIPDKELRDNYTDSVTSLIRPFTEMIWCQIQNWKTLQTDSTHYVSVCKQQIDELFSLKFDFSKVRKHEWYDKP